MLILHPVKGKNVTLGFINQLTAIKLVTVTDVNYKNESLNLIKLRTLTVYMNHDHHSI